MPVFLTVIFLLSLSGYYLAYGLFIKRHVSFFPVLFAAFTVIILYVSGLAGILRAGFYIILGLGILLIPFSVLKKKDGIIPLLKETVLDPSLLFMAAGTVWIWLITKGVSLSHGDDFSHWYRICKMMHFENAYPTQPDTLFTTYVPGTATWIWFITSITGFAPDKCFFAHSLLNLASLNAFFSLGSRIPKERKTSGKVLLFIFVTVMSVVLCSMNVNTYCLLTDTTLALIPLAAMFFVLSGNDASDMTGLILFTALMCFEILTKVAGIPFAVFMCIFRNILLKKDFRSAGIRKALEKLLPALIPFAFFFAYIIRAKIVFGALEESGQGFSIKRFLSVFLMKTGSQISDILGRFMREMFDVSGVMSMQVMLLWLIFICLALAMFITRKKKDGQEELRKAAPALFVFFAVYSVFLLLTYVFSMNTREANADLLNCFYRYIGSVTIFVSGTVSYIIFGMFLKKTGRTATIAASAFCAVWLLTGVFMFDTGYIAGYSHYRPVEEFTTASWDLLSEYAPERDYYSEDSFFVIYNAGEVIDCTPVKTRVAASTYFRSNNVYALSIEDLRAGGFNEQNLELLGNCDYLVTLGDFSDQLDVIGNYVDVKDYRPGMISLKD